MKTLYFFTACLFTSWTAVYAEGFLNPGCLEKEKALALLETAENLLTKARASFPSCKEDVNTTDESECGSKKPLAYIEISKKLISDVRENFPTCPKPVEEKEKIVKDDKPRDCSEILSSGRNKSGVYTIWSEVPFTSGKSLQVYCDMEGGQYKHKGGWTVIQRRGKYPVQQDFYQDWETYKNGFGNLTEEFWLGNENIRVLCDKGCGILFDLEDKNGNFGYALYQNFTLSSSNYRLSIGGFKGSIADGMKFHNNLDFSTKDKGLTSRAQKFKGGWWYISGNWYGNLNGIYQPGESNFESVHWHPWRQSENLARVEMKVKPK